MKSAAYYNEIDPFAAQWLRNLIAAGHIAPGDVDTRSITDVRADDIRHYTQCHFFAGVGVWSYALRLAGWPDDRPVWTGSCPCQPFSAAGKGEGFADDRHLYPAWSNLIRECRPARIYGEQVEAAIRHGWIDLVQDDMEASGYAFGKVCLPAASVGAPHIRSRLWFMAHTLGDTKNSGCFRGKLGNEAKTEPQAYCGGEKEGCRWHDVANDGTSSNLANTLREQTHTTHKSRLYTSTASNSDACRLADTTNKGFSQWRDKSSQQSGQIEQSERLRSDDQLADTMLGKWNKRPNVESNRRTNKTEQDGMGCFVDELANANSAGCIQGSEPAKAAGHRHPVGADGWDDRNERPDEINQFWRAADWLFCRDGKWRPVEPGTFPLADRVTGRVGRLRAYGNAIVPQVAAEIIKATM